MWFSVVLAIIILLFLYLIGQRNERYWKRRNVKFIKKNKVFGVFWDYLIGDKSTFELFNEFYKKYPEEPAIAFGSFFTPSLYVKDPVNVEHVMISDYQCFNHRGFAFDAERDKLSNNVLMLYGPKWKLLRYSLSPLFTTAKLKKMYYIMDRSAQDFVEYLKTNPKKLEGDAFETLNTFCCAAIAASVFGLGVESTFKSPIIPFVRSVLQTNFVKNLKMAVSFLCPPLAKFLRISMFVPDSLEDQEWFIDAIRKVIRVREQKDLTMYDFIDMCVTLQRNGKLKDHETGFEMEPTDEVLAAQAFFFFLAGLEPCAALMFAAMVELGRNPDVLQKLHEEIDNTFEKSERKITYDDVVDMKYLDNILDEALRLYPPIGFVTRECIKDTVLPVGKIKVDKGTKIYLPIYDFQMDPRYFENPEKFDPDRFTQNKIVSETEFLPFGKGNRTCIGKRYAKLQVKSGMIHVLRHFTIKTIVNKGGIQFRKEQVQVRLRNVDFELIPRR